MVCLSNYYFGASYALFQYLFFIFLFIPQLSVKRQIKTTFLLLSARGFLAEEYRCLPYFSALFSWLKIYAEQTDSERT